MKDLKVWERRETERIPFIVENSNEITKISNLRLFRGTHNFPECKKITIFFCEIYFSERNSFLYGVRNLH